MPLILAHLVFFSLDHTLLSVAGFVIKWASTIFISLLNTYYVDDQVLNIYDGHGQVLNLYVLNIYNGHGQTKALLLDIILMFVQGSLGSDYSHGERMQDFFTWFHLKTMW
jgi:hypothetical protein